MELGGSLPHSQQSTNCPYPSQINPFLCPSHFWQAQFVSFSVGLRTYQHLGYSAQQLKVYVILIYLLTAIRLPPGGSSTVHIYTQTVCRISQLTTLVGRFSGVRTQSGQTNWQECGPCPVFASYTLAFVLQLRGKKKLNQPHYRPGVAQRVPGS
jgi:hypothetical protein